MNALFSFELSVYFSRLITRMRNIEFYDFKKIFFSIIVVSLLFSKSQAQITAGSTGDIEPRTLIDKPTAGMMKHGSFGMSIDFFQTGGVLFNLNAGVMERLSFGISYGGTNIIGSNQVAWNKSPGVNLKFRLFDEENSFPAICFGFDSQGKETFIDSLNRYRVKSLGFYATGSKNIEIMGYLSLHAGINRTLETNDNDKDLNFFIGAEKTIGRDASFIVEYDFGNNDSKPPLDIEQKSRLHSGFRWNFGRGITLGINLKEIHREDKVFSIGNRTIFVEYINIF